MVNGYNIVIGYDMVRIIVYAQYLSGTNVTIFKNFALKSRQGCYIQKAHTIFRGKPEN